MRKKTVLLGHNKNPIWPLQFYGYYIKIVKAYLNLERFPGHSHQRLLK